MTTTETIFGPPGTGKTTRLIDVVGRTLESGTPPARVGYVSFTKKAAGEAMERAAAKFDGNREKFPWFRTLHSLCFRRLGLRSGDVLEGDALRDFANWAGIRVTGRGSEDGSTATMERGDRILHMEHLARVRAITLQKQFNEDDDGLPWSEVSRVSRALVEYKRDHGLMDYTDMLADFVERGKPPELDELVVDEAQDQSQLQWRVVEKLAAGCKKLTIAGDDDQAIYRWAGADAGHMLDLEGESQVLDHSWRVPREIQVLAEKIVEPISRRRKKLWRPREGAGKVDHAAMLQHADLSGDDVLILARNVYVIREQIEPLLKLHGIIYERKGRSSVARRVLSAVADWEKLRRGETVSAERARAVYDYMTVDVGVARGSKTLPGVNDETELSLSVLRAHHGLLRDDVWHHALDRLPPDEKFYLLHALRRGEKPTTGRPRVRVSTIHSEKGGEAKHVVLLTEMAQRTRRELDRWPDDERRVWYVALTRARERLTIVRSSGSQGCPWL